MAELDTYTPHDREVAITGMLDQARTWLAHAVESSAPAQDIANFKAFIATAAETARRLKVSKEIQVDAEVMVRRSERALGQAIRSGQERGEIAANGERLNRGLPNEKTSADEFFSGGGETSNVYALTDDVTDDDFNTALDRAQGEQNVSRANVVRKVREVQSGAEVQTAKWARVAEMAASGHASAQIARELGVGESGIRQGARDRGIDIRADRVLGRIHRLDSNRIIRESASALENIISGLALINPDDIDPEEAQQWTDSLTASRDALSKAIHKIQKRKSIQ